MLNARTVGLRGRTFPVAINRSSVPAQESKILLLALDQQRVMLGIKSGHFVGQDCEDPVFHDQNCVVFNDQIEALIRVGQRRRRGRSRPPAAGSWHDP